MKTILSVLLAAVMLLSVLSGCARDMSGETRQTPGTSTMAPTNSPASTSQAKSTPKATASTGVKGDGTADGVIDEGEDAVDGVVGAGEDAVDDIVDAGEDIVDDVTGNQSGAAKSTPKATANQ